MNPELIKLRISIARVAQAHGVDNHLNVTGLSYEQLHRLAEMQPRGWNDLARLCAEQATAASDFIRLSAQ